MTVSTALPPMPRQYTAQIVRSDGARSRIYCDGVRQRVELHGPNCIHSIVISRPDRGVAWSFLPDSPVIQETPFAAQTAQSILDPIGALDWKEDGVERIDGVECVRYRGRYKFPAGGAHELCFVERSTGIRRRHVTFDRTGARRLTVDCSVTLGPPDPALFEIPQGYSIRTS